MWNPLFSVQGGCLEDQSRGCKKNPKEVVQYANSENPDRYIVRLYKLLVNQKCSFNQPLDAFYLKPKVNPKSDGCWYDARAVEHNI